MAFPKVWRRGDGDQCALKERDGAMRPVFSTLPPTCPPHDPEYFLLVSVPSLVTWQQPLFIQLCGAVMRADRARGPLEPTWAGTHWRLMRQKRCTRQDPRRLTLMEMEKLEGSYLETGWERSSVIGMLGQAACGSPGRAWGRWSSDYSGRTPTDGG